MSLDALNADVIHLKPTVSARDKYALWGDNISV